MQVKVLLFLLSQLKICEFVLLHVFLVYWEEPNLKQRLGQEYLDYLDTVPRWF